MIRILALMLKNSMKENAIKCIFYNVYSYIYLYDRYNWYIKETDMMYSPLKPDSLNTFVVLDF